MRIIYTILLAAMLAPAYSADNPTQCHELRWKITDRSGQWATIRGHVRPGTKRVDIELHNASKIIGQTIAWPNLAGNWQARIHADYIIKRSHKPRFYCAN